MQHKQHLSPLVSWSSIGVSVILFLGIVLWASSIHIDGNQVQADAGQSYTSSKIGNWNDPTTWSPVGVPSAGDTAIIQYPVTVTSSVSIGDNSSAALALLIRGNFTIADGGSLTIKGNVLQQLSTTVTGNSGGKIIFDSTDASPSSTTWTWKIGDTYFTEPERAPKVVLRGQANNRFRVESKAGGGNGRFTNGNIQGGGSVDAEYTDFIRIGDSANMAMGIHDQSRGGLILRLFHCNFYQSGEVSPAAVNGTRGSLTNGWNIWDISYSKFLSPASSMVLTTYATTAVAGGVHRISNNDFGGRVEIAQLDFDLSGNVYRADWKLGNNNQTKTAAPYSAAQYLVEIGQMQLNMANPITVRLPSGDTATSPVTVQLSDGGAGGNFSPASVQLTTQTPSVTVTYTPTSLGPRVFTATNDRELFNPAAVLANVTTPATTYVMDAPSPATSVTGAPSENFTAALPSYSTINGTVTITPSDNGGGGSFSPSSVTLSEAAPSATFTYQGNQAGNKTISFANNRSLTNPSPVILNVSASSTLAGFTVEGPAKGDVTINSSPFTVTLGNGTINGIIRITPSASNNDGTFTPASVSLTNSTRTATFTYKPLKWGKRTLSFSNDRGLANQAGMEFVGMAQIGKSDNYSFSGRPGPSLGGFDVLNYGDWKTFKQSVRNVPVDQYSDRYIERLAGLSVYPGFSAPRATGGYGYGAGYNIVRGDTPRVPIDYLEYVSESESGPMPFAPDLQIEDHPSNSALPPTQKNGGDQHTHVYVRNEETGGIKEVIECQTIWSETLGQSWKANSCSTWDIDALDAGGPGVTQATATPVIVGGKVKSITVTNGGFGYTVAPQVFIRKGNRGIGAHAKATIENGRVTSIQVLSEGANYDPGTRVFFGGLRPEGDTSSDAAGLPNTPLAVHYDEVASGDVGHAMRFTLAAWRTPVAVTATVAVAGGRVTGMTVTSPGTGLIYPPTVTFSGGGGAGAAATATVSNGKVTGFIITNGGSGYTSAPSVSFSGTPLIRNRFVYPARHAVYSGLPDDGMPMGTRFRLSESWYQANKNRFTGQGKVIMEGMYKYGMVLADIGLNMDMQGTLDSRWKQSELEQLRTIPVTAFDVLEIKPKYELTGPTQMQMGQTATFNIKYLHDNDSNFARYLYIKIINKDTGVNMSTMPFANRPSIENLYLWDNTRAGSLTFKPPSVGTYEISALGSSDSMPAPKIIFQVTSNSPATSYTLTPPSITSGTVNQPSGNFTVVPNGLMTGTITPAGAGCTFSPTSLTWSNAADAKTFTCTPTTVGVKTITTTNTAGLTNPGSVTYTATAAAASSSSSSTPSTAATSYTLTPPSITSGPANQPSGNFTVTPNGLFTGTVTPSTTGGGTFTPASLVWAGASNAQTFTYTPATVGAKLISVTNNGGLPNPASITYTATTANASSYTLTPPSITSGPVNTPSGNFTITPNGLFTGTITPSTTGGGTFTPASRTWTNTNNAQTFTYTPTTVGTKLIAVANTGGLPNPADVIYTSVDVSASPSSSSSSTPSTSATSYTFTAPSQTSGTVNTPSGNFTITPNGLFTGTITPSTTGGGTFTPASRTWTNTNN
ncbi:MAG: hypothetical protein KBD00_06065, partial [Candidatus Peribacteraceae bacterium]|nr:hypothetical protein [Candidatus Peribacteraceae bacterium]